MFDIGWSELLVIGIVALVFIGPKELPALLRTLGQGMSKLRSMAADFQSQFQDALREAELDELRKQAEKVASEASSFNPIEKATTEIQAAIEAPSQPAPSAPPAESAPDRDSPPAGGPAEGKGA
jgi:sec-independent protein translocase protein TatB